MSTLYYTEQGHIISTLCEEVTTFRRVRKVLNLPPTTAPGWLYFLAYAYPGSDLPMHVSVNGVEIPTVAPEFHLFYAWYTVRLQPGWLRPGENVFEFWTDSTAMNAWSLGIESGYAQPGSFVSDDGGRTWRNEKLGFLNVLLGEYIVRVRLAEGQDPPPPLMAWEDLDHPRLASLRKLLPPEALEKVSLLSRVRALSTWLSTSWAHEGSVTAALYAPWDAETILAWGRVRKGPDQRLPITMCVHYGSAFVSACMAAHIPARCLVGTTELNGMGGHFVAEVWFAKHNKWGVIDPNVDAIYLRGDVPVTVEELRAAGTEAGKLAVLGPGAAFQRRFPHMENFIKAEIFQDATWADHRCLWPRTDFLSHPELTPPGHGMTSYSETKLVWENKDQDEGFGMFPFFGNPAYFNAPPSAWKEAM
jgi:hypothetical protein